MIVSLLMGLLGAFFDILPVLEIENIAILENLIDSVDVGLNYINSGISFLGALIGHDTVFLLGLYMSLVLSIDVFYLAYQTVWFFIKKIPLIDIKQ